MYTYTHYMYDCEYSVAMGDILKAAGDFSVQNTLFTKGNLNAAKCITAHV